MRWLAALSVMAIVVAACSGPAAPVEKPLAAPPQPRDAPPEPDGYIPDAFVERASMAELAAAEKEAWQRAKPVFDHYCAKCHTKRGRYANAKRLDALDLTKYPPGGRYAKLAGDVVRDVLGQSGPAAKMPFDKPGAVQGAELALVMAWADAWARAHREVPHDPL